MSHKLVQLETGRITCTCGWAPARLASRAVQKNQANRHIAEHEAPAVGFPL